MSLTLAVATPSEWRFLHLYRPGEAAGPGTVSHLTMRLAERTDCPYYWEKPAGTYLLLCCRGRWDLTQGYAALARHIAEKELRTSGRVYACDLAGFILNGVESNAATVLSVRLAEKP